MHGALVIDGGGQVIVYRAHNIYDGELMQQVSRAIASAIDAVKLVQEDWESITTHFSDGKLLIRNIVVDGGRAHALALIADGRLNPSFATVAIRVAIGKLKSALQNGAPAKAPAAAPSNGPSASSSVVAPVPPGAPQAFSKVKPATSEVSSSGLSWSGLSGSTASPGSTVSVADPASSAILTACTKALARNVGPMAKLFVKEAVRKISPDRPFSRENTEALVTELAKNIENPSDAAQFKTNMLKAL